jgi:branched-chain amino acid transport system substrate-binding protein
MARSRGDLSLFRRILSDLERDYPGMDYLAQAGELQGPAQVPVKAKYTLGVILPLSGIHQTFGTRVLQAIQLAARESNPQNSPPLLSLVLHDSKGNPREAGKAVEDLSRKEKAIAILGPLLSATVDSAAGRAQHLKIPMMTFCQKETSVGGGDFVFQNALTPAAQVQALVAYAMKDMELRTFAVFFPNSSYGILYKNLFNQEVSRRAGKVLGSVAYQEDQTDFSQEIKGFFRIKPTGGSDDPKKKTEAYQPGITVDAIFIPDTYDRAGLLLAQLAYFDVPVHAFLGPNAWNHPRLISIAGSASEKALFVDCFFRNSESPAVNSFVAGFKKAHQKEPETLEAIGYDGVRFLTEILQTETVSSSLRLREEIIRKEKFRGVSGLSGFGEKGKPVRDLLILGVRENKIVQVHP